MSVRLRRTTSFREDNNVVKTTPKDDNEFGFFEGIDFDFKKAHKDRLSLFSSLSGFNNYRGLLNLCVILLAISCTRLVLDNIFKYGLLLDPFVLLELYLRDPFNWPAATLVLSLNFNVLAAHFLELFCVRDLVSVELAHILHSINIAISFFLTPFTIAMIAPNPLTTLPALFASVIVCFKLISFKQVNSFQRVQTQLLMKERSGRQRSVSALVVPNYKKMKDDMKVVYPYNLSIKKMYYFIFAPTLCYDLNYPCTGKFRPVFFARRLIEAIFLTALSFAIIQQWIIPSIYDSKMPLKDMDFYNLIGRILKLAIPEIFLWLIFFYTFFHSCLNILAEILCFGDRFFYDDWWNAANVTEFWKKWNIPVHKWCSRHVYIPLRKSGFSSFKASLIVFLISAFFHEMLVSVPLKMLRLHFFVGMVMQVPFAYFSSKCDEHYGNVFMWAVLILGQPFLVLMYFHDYYYYAA